MAGDLSSFPPAGMEAFRETTVCPPLRPSQVRAAGADVGSFGIQTIVFDREPAGIGR
jgi:hypothetical protein